MELIIINSITFILIGIFFGVISKSQNEKINRSKGKHTLQHNIVFKYFGILLMSFPAIICVILFYHKNHPDITEMVTAFGIVASIFGIVGLYFYLDYKNHFITYTKKIITCSNYLNKTTTINLEDIETIRFNALSGKLLLTDKKGKQIKINQFLKGINPFIHFLEKETNIDLTKIKDQINAYSIKK